MTDVIQSAIQEASEELIALAQKIWDNPEIGWKEKQAAQWTAEVLRAHGFETEVGAYGLPTCIRAVWGTGKPVVGFCGEYDCLPGLSQNRCPDPSPIVPGGYGHGCGHNLLGVGCLGACIGLKAGLQKAGLPGTVIYYGCPAEEQMTGKGFMAKNGAFQECDFTYAWHPTNGNSDTLGSHVGNLGAHIHFTGRTAHAGAAPHLGRSALDAAQLMNIGVEFMREHVTDDVRIHYIITDGGQAPNIVPGRASVKYNIRALSMDAVRDAYNRVVHCAEGAARMTDTQVEVEYLGGLYPTLQNTVLGQAIQDAKALVPLHEYTEEELAFADRINSYSEKYVKGVTRPIDAEDHPLGNFTIFGSTDYGDVQHICPGFQLRVACESTLSAGHSWMRTACVGTSIGNKGMIRAAKLMAVASFLLMSDPAKLAAAQEEFAREMGGSVYECPIDDSIPRPYEEE